MWYANSRRVVLSGGVLILLVGLGNSMWKGLSQSDSCTNLIFRRESLGAGRLSCIGFELGSGGVLRAGVISL